MGFREQLKDLLELEARPVHKIGHQPRLYALTQAIAERFDIPHTYDDDVVFAAAYLHDLGVFVGHRPEGPEDLAAWDNVSYACAQAPGILRGVGFPEGKIEAVLACIREHRAEDEPQTLEAALLRDADMLEQLGTIGILRTAAKVGSDTRFHTFLDARNALVKAINDLPEKLLLRASKELASKKIAIHLTFIEMLDAEAGGHLG